MQFTRETIMLGKRFLPFVFFLFIGMLLVAQENTKFSLKEYSTGEVITNSIGMKIKLVRPGFFLMGSDNGYSSEKPMHKVFISKPFYMGIYEVTQEQYKAVMGENPSKFKGPNLPVESVTWSDTKIFCDKLSKKEGKIYCLPTEAEWEYVCRAGTKTNYYWGNSFDPDFAWYEGNSNSKTQEVGLKKSNNWDFFDLSGNVSEWCEDYYSENYYRQSQKKDLFCLASHSMTPCQTIRGGSWAVNARWCQAFSRHGIDPWSKDNSLGFRIIRR